MRFTGVRLALVFLAGRVLSSDASAQAAADAPMSECEQARRDWAANDPPTPTASANDRLAYLKLSTDTQDLRADLDCDRRLSFDEYFAMQWASWRRMDANEDGAVSQAEWITEWCDRRLGGLIEEHPDWRASCESASASTFHNYLGSRRPGGIDQHAYRYTVRISFRRADRNRDRYLTRPPNSAHYYE